MITETMPLGPTGHHPHKATLLKLGVITDLPNTQKQAKEAAKMWKQINMPQIKEQKKSPEKELNEEEASNLSDIQFKKMVIRMLKELSENYNSMKKDIETI